MRLARTVERYNADPCRSSTLAIERQIGASVASVARAATALRVPRDESLSEDPRPKRKSDRPPRTVDQLSRLSLRQPPARLLAMICLNIAASAGALMVSPWRTATVRAVVLSCPPVMIFSGSGTMAPS